VATIARMRKPQQDQGATVKKYGLERSAAIIAMGLSSTAAANPSSVNMPRGVTEISAAIYDLHMLIFWICVIIGIVVFGAIFWSLIHHRKSLGVQPAKFHESTRLEIAWTLVPTLILVAMAWPATKVLIEMYDTGGEDLTVEVRGYQWRWQYKYLDDDLNSSFGFFSSLSTPREEVQGIVPKGEFYLLEVDNPLRIPANRKVRFLLTAEDVIHAWWVPDFGIKRDAIPGILNEMWTVVPEPGIYRGMCTELCGKDHAFMPIVVQVMAEDEYDTWYAEQLVAEQTRREALSRTFTREELMVEGEKTYNTFCASCHMPNGRGVPPVFPALAGSAVATGPLEDHIRLMINGVPGSAMQAFGRQLDPAQLAAVTHYARHAWGNNAGDIVQPRDIIAIMESQQ
jgi:cytochrome c oxidase subunit 2